MMTEADFTRAGPTAIKRTFSVQVWSDDWIVFGDQIAPYGGRWQKSHKHVAVQFRRRGPLAKYAGLAFLPGKINISKPEPV